MQRWRDFVLWLYIRLLRLYPAEFRAEFGEEMIQVFTLAIGEAEDFSALLGIVGAEVRDLPFSVIREHQRERSGFAMLEADSIIDRRPIRVFHFCTRGMLYGGVLYALTAVLPFFLLGMHLLPSNRVAAGYFDPTSLPVYGDGRGHGNALWFAIIMILLVTPLLEMLLGARLMTLLIRSGSLLKPSCRFMGMAAMILSIGLIVFAISPSGLLLLGWWLD